MTEKQKPVEPIGGYVYGCPLPTEEIIPVKIWHTAEQEREAIIELLIKIPCNAPHQRAIMTHAIDLIRIGAHWVKRDELMKPEIPKMPNIDVLALAEHNRIVNNARKEEREAITAYIDARANWLSSRLDEPDFDPDETDIVVECIEELHSIASRIKLNKHLE